ncbi:MAG: ABC transporter permease subunit [Alphaproteobacteria bacterium]|nr:ABC transporter permease subunit [Alphaproteobacteria bacterium SS10]
MEETLALFAIGDTGWGDELLRGLQMTVMLALVSYAIGFLIGLLGAAAKLSKYAALRGAAEGYTTIIRGVPEILIVFLIFFGGSIALQNILQLIGYTEYIEINQFAAGVVALATVSGAYQTEVLRAGILAVPKGQIEAARAVGMPGLLLFRRIMLPQVLRYALPALGNLWLVMLKDTAIISVVGLEELIRATDVAGRSSRMPFTFFMAAALLYLALTAVSMAGIQLLERFTMRGVRPMAKS